MGQRQYRATVGSESRRYETEQAAFGGWLVMLRDAKPETHAVLDRWDGDKFVEVIAVADRLQAFQVMMTFQKKQGVER